MSPDDLIQIARLVAALAFVLALMAGLGLLIKKLGLSGSAAISGAGKKRLKIIESLPLDARRRLVIVQCDAKQHLIIIGANSETVIDSDLPVTPESDTEKDKDKSNS